MGLFVASFHSVMRSSLFSSLPTYFSSVCPCVSYLYLLHSLQVRDSFCSRGASWMLQIGSTQPRSCYTTSRMPVDLGSTSCVVDAYWILVNTSVTQRQVSPERDISVSFVLYQKRYHGHLENFLLPFISTITTTFL